MIKALILSLLFLLTINFVKAQIIDRTPTDEENYRAVEGGSDPVKIDSKTPLPDLIKRLEKPWQFVETGKMYWIGYTDNMYSIAVHKDSAIKPLINFIESTNNKRARIGAVYTLHLIGIDRKIVGRFTEDFVNKNARDALLYLLKYDDLRNTSIELLIRDPWLSDVPKLFSLLNNEHSSPGDYVNGLLHYRLKEIPLNKAIPEDIGNLTVSFPTSYPDQTARDFGVEPESQEILHLIAALHNRKVKVDTALFGEKLWGNMYYPIEGKLINYKWCISVADFLNKIATPNDSQFGMDYFVLGNKIYYHVQGNKMTICSAATAKTILLKWWADQPESYKQQFNQDKAKAIR